MALAERSIQVTDSYRERLAATRENVQRKARESWPSIDELDRTDWPQRTATLLSQAQREVVRAGTGYLSAFLTTELGARTRGPALDSRKFAGVSRDGRPLADAL